MQSSFHPPRFTLGFSSQISMSSPDEGDVAIESAKVLKRKRLQRLKVQLLEDLEAAGGINRVVAGTSNSLAQIRSQRYSFYSQYTVVEIENFFYYWKKFDECKYRELLESVGIQPRTRIDQEPNQGTAETETMASSTGGPGRGRGRGVARAPANANPINQNNMPPPIHIGKFQRRRELLASNLVTHMRALQCIGS
ncbi:MAG: hypothetical protein ACRCZI_04855 [Cetobacterium sp.]